MSEEKRTPISIYLTPRAATILREYSVGSGYGSVSRTVEEIILAFDAVYETIIECFQILNTLSEPEKQREWAAKNILAFLVYLQTMRTSVSRLQKESGV